MAPDPPPAAGDLQYAAFISYRHVEPDRSWALWLHRALESYRIPTGISHDAAHPRRLGRVFLDREELGAAADLGREVEGALGSARNLVVVCSPRTPLSQWVAREIEAFRALPGRGEILALLIEGEPSQSFPRALTEGGIREPLAADVRPEPGASPRERKNQALLRVVAALLRCSYDALRRRDQQRRARTLRLVLAATTTLAAAFAGLALYALVQRDEARLQTQIARAERERATARAVEARASALASRSQVTRGTDPMLALLLARAACRLQPSPDSFQALRDALRDSRCRAVLHGQEGRILEVAFSPAGDLLLTAAEDGSVRLWDLAGRLRRTIRLGALPVGSAEFAPDGRHVLTASGDHAVEIWDLDGRRIAGLAPGAPPVARALFSPTGTRILTVSLSGQLDLWSVEGTHMVTLDRLEPMVEDVCFSADGAWLAATFLQKVARVYDLDGGGRFDLVGHEDTVSRVQFSPDGAYVVTGAHDGTLRTWRKDGTPLGVLRGPKGGAQGIALLGKGESVAAVGGDVALRMWDPSGKLVSEEAFHSDEIVRVVVSADSRVLVTGSRDHTARVIPVAAPHAGVLLRGHQGTISGLAIYPDGRWVATASQDRTVRLWETFGVEVAACVGHDGPVTAVAVSQDGSRVATASTDGTARVWDVDGRPLAVLRAHRSRVYGVCFTPDGERVATSGDDGTWRLWNTRGEAIATYEAGEQVVLTIACSPDGTRFLTGGMKARVWNDRGVELHVLDPEGGPVFAAGFTPDGSRSYCGLQSGVLQFWDEQGSVTGSVGEVVGHALLGAAISEDGERVALRFEDGSVRVWGPGKELLATNRSAPGLNRSLAFLSQGYRLVVPRMDGTVPILDAEGAEEAVLHGHDGPVFAAATSRDGRHIVTAGRDGTARIWLVEREDLLALADARALRDFTAAEREAFAFLLDD
jgi:WD40 repeat protein